MGIGTSKRGKLYGVGFCSTDLKGSVKSINTHPYNVWKSILERSYDSKFHEKNPSYRGVEVCESWHDYQNFYTWYIENYYEVRENKMNLDKDILCPGNKIYSPDTCAFVPQAINLLLTDCRRSRGVCPQGVHFHKRSGKYQASLRAYGKHRYLGQYNSKEEAFRVYKNAKEYYVKQKADEYRKVLPKAVYGALRDYVLEG